MKYSYFISTIGWFFILLLHAYPQSDIQYQYDNLNRLERIEYPNGTVVVFTYDEVGNRETQTISNNAAAPSANFTANPTSGFAPLQVTFTDASVPGANPITSWSWDFENDGNPDASGQGPHTYVYDTPGVYSVKLTVSDGIYNSEHLKTGYITVNAPANLPPVVVNPIPAQGFNPGGPDYVRDLEAAPAVFSDPESDVLSYAASSSNPAVAGAMMNGTVLTVSPLTEGSATITVTADDGNGGITSTQFDVTVGGGEPPLDFLWANAGGGVGEDLGRAVAADGAGRVAVFGDFQNDLTIGNTTLNSGGATDLFLAQYDRIGNLRWVRQAGGSGEIRANDVACDLANNIIVTGYYYGTVNFDGNQLNSSGSYDVFIAKYDVDGNLVWAKSAGGSYDDSGVGIATDFFNRIVVTGFYTGSADFDGEILNSGGDSDIFLVRYNASGTQEWVRSAGGADIDVAQDVTVFSNSDICISGYFLGSAGFGNLTPLSNSDGTKDVFLAYYTGNGDAVWARQASASGDIVSYGLTKDNNGGVAIAGYFNGSATFDALSLNSNGAEDIFITNYDIQGNVQWARGGGGSSNDIARSVTVDNNSNIYVVGDFSSTATFGATTLTSAGGNDVIILKYNPDGSVAWARQAGGSGEDTGYRIYADPYNDILVSGSFSSTANFGDLVLTSVNGADMFVAKQGINYPPTVNNPISDQLLLPGGTAFVRDLEADPAVFVDLNGDVLGYSVTSSDAGIAAASVNETVLTVTPGAVGTATITVTADDGNGGQTSTGFQVTVDINPGSIFETKLAASNGTFDDRFGDAVDLWDDWALVGAFRGTDGSGTAYVYHYDGANWIEEAILTASDGAYSGQRFGDVLELEGDYAVIGAYLDAANGPASGAVYIFKRDSQTGDWNEQAKLTPDDGAANDWFGFDVALSGDYVVITAREDDDNGDGSGSAYVFKRSGETWVQQAKLSASDGAAGDQFGMAVSIDGDYILVSAGEDDDNGDGSGSAYIFKRDSESWNQQAKILPLDGEAGDQFGFSAVLAGDYLLVGARYEGNGDQSGAAYVFRRSGNSWVQHAKLKASDADGLDYFGGSVALSGIYALVGAFGDEDNGASAGAAYLYKREGDNWIEIEKLHASDGAANDEFGNAVTIFGARCMVGAWYDDDNGEKSGSAYIYTGYSAATPLADFAADINAGNAPLTVQFSDASTPGLKALTSWSWDFDNDGNLDASGQGPHTYVYDNPGVYSVKLTVSDGSYTSEHLETDYITVNPPANQPPLVANPIPDQTLYVGESDFIRDLEAAPVVFSDPDNDPLIYYAISSDAAVATATLIGSTLTVSANAPGTATIMVTADDGNGGEVYTTFLVNAEIIQFADDFLWAKSAGGASNDEGFSLVEDSQGNIIVSGYFTTSATFGTITVNSAYTSNIFVAKYDPQGNIIWVRHFGNASINFRHQIALDAADNIFIVGNFQGTTYVGPIQLTSSGESDIFIAKYNASGDFIWVDDAGGSSNDYGYGIAVDNTGNFYITGAFKGTTTFGHLHNLTSAGDYDVFLVKYDNTGNVVWTHRAGGGGAEHGYDLVYDPSNSDIYLIGEYNSSSIDFGVSSLSNSGNSDVFVVNYDQNGSVNWAEGVGSDGFERGYGIALNNSGNVLITGAFSNSLNLGNTNLTSAGNFDIYVAEYDGAGNWLWAEQAGGSLNDIGYAIAGTADNGALITGFFNGNADFGLYNLISSGGRDAVVAKLDNTGNFRWAKKGGGSSDDSGYDIIRSNTGEGIISGYFGAAAVFSPYTLQSAGGDVDILIAKMNDTIIGNQPPVVENSIDNQSLYVGGSSFSRDLEATPAVFSDPDNDILTYTVNSSAANVASVDITGAILTIIPQTEGSTEILITAYDGNGGQQSTTFQVDVSAILFQDINAALPGVSVGAVAWGDYDNDQDLDIVITGDYVAKIYRNDNNDSFVDINANIPGVSNSAVEWGDYDNDGDLDLLIAGSTYSGRITKIYRNDGNNIFTDIDAGLVGINQGTVSWSDYDNDGDRDVLLTGFDENVSRVLKLYRNDGSDTFVELNANMVPVNQSSLAWGDYDLDHDADLLLTGWDDNGVARAEIYRNDGNGQFVETDFVIHGVWGGSGLWGDYDSDGDLDILVTGYSPGGEVLKIYRNTGSDFINTNISLTGLRYAKAAWGDYDNDGDLDLLIAGEESASNRVSKIYRNDGNEVFTDILNVNLAGVSWGAVAWGDYNNDRILDILLAGSDGTNKITKIYKNKLSTPNSEPLTPSQLSVVPQNNSAIFSWFPASDDETQQTALTYNLRIGTVPGGVDIVSPMALLGTGYRWVVAMGNTFQDTSWTVSNLPPGTYYWSVQAIDNAFAGSEFAPEESFTIASAAVTGVSVKVKNNDVMLSWNLSPGATQYHIYRGAEPYISPEAIYAAVTDTFFVDPNAAVVDTIDYFYTIKAMNGATELGVSEQIGKCDYALRGGWNLIAIPTMVQHTSIDSVIGAQLTGGAIPSLSDVIYHFNGSSYQSAWYHEPSQKWFGTLTTIEPDKGYWVYILPGHSDTLVTFVGAVPDSNRVVPVSVGWNMVGSSFPQEVLLPESNLSGSGFTGGATPVLSDVVYEYGAGGYTSAWLHAASGGWYGSLSRFQGGKGYWIFVRPDHAGFVWNYTRQTPAAIISGGGKRIIPEPAVKRQNEEGKARQEPPKKRIKMKVGKSLQQQAIDKSK